MAELGYLTLKHGGTDLAVEFGQDNTRRTMGAEDVETALEIVEFQCAVNVGSSRTADARATAARSWEAARFTARVGKSTPLLFQALQRNERIDLSLRLFWRNSDTGETQLQQTFEIDQGRVVEARLHSPNALNPDTASMPTLMSFAVIPHTVRVISAAGTECVDNYSESA